MKSVILHNNNPFFEQKVPWVKVLCILVKTIPELGL